ncbi:hypothetical protein HF086_000721 [Spodoptera exigua]|uniref:Uncharacterized protein n=1 Tax=Spodoptera exigua TaxID=7107 RepID=A0A922M5E3_SPOEX|nr:hypothetical protein HF086_000721 [Spodoptera exigua]
MKAALVFDSVNDLENQNDVTENNTVSQLLAPIITSQRVMAAQFGNTYSSMQCKDKTTIVFDEWLDHVFVIISEDNVDDAHRELLDFKTFVQHICGQNVNLRGSEDLSPPDLILLSIQCIAAQEYWKEVSNEDSDENDPQIVRLPWLSTENSAVVNLCAGPTGSPCAPHSIHLAEVAPRITFAVVVDMDLREVGVSTYMANQILSNLRRLLLQRNLELLPNTLDALETALKKTTDALRKNKANSNLCARLTSRMLELRKSCTTTTPLTPETTATAMHTALEAVIEQLKPDIPSLKMEQPLKNLRTTLAPYSTSESDASCSLTLHKYVEEFPGLIHFIYVDRTAGRFLAPDMADCADMLAPETVSQKLYIEFRSSRILKLFRTLFKFTCGIQIFLCVVREGYCAGTWRRGALHACALLWWERRAQPVRPVAPPHPAAVRALPPPGDIQGSFYRQLTELAFPGDSRGITVKELICIHLGLLPASTAVQQARRLAHSVHELAGEIGTGAADLL